MRILNLICFVGACPPMSQPKEKKKSAYFRLLSEVGEYRKDALLSPLCTIGCVILEILIPYLTASLIDDGISKRNPNLGMMAPLLEGLMMELTINVPSAHTMKSSITSNEVPFCPV